MLFLLAGRRIWCRSINRPTFFWLLPNTKLMEAGASGCPIVTTSVGIAKTGLFINGQNSLVCRICDTGCISAGILDIISDNSKRELFKHKMQDSIKSIAISKEKYAEKYVSLLKKLLND